MDFKKIFREETGATIIEYALLCAFISMAVILTLNGIVPNLKNVFYTINNAFL